MKKIIISLVILFAFSMSMACTYEWVNGYFRHNGTYVQGYWRCVNR